MILENDFCNWQKMMGWGRCWTPSRTSKNHLVFDGICQHFPQNHQSLLSSMPKKYSIVLNQKKPSKKKKKKKLAQPQIEIVYTFAHLHFIYSKKTCKRWPVFFRVGIWPFFFWSPYVQPTKSGIKEKGAWKATKVNLDPGWYVKLNGSFVGAKMAPKNELLFSKRGASFFCWETLRIFCGVGVASTNFWLNGKNICKKKWWI